MIRLDLHFGNTFNGIKYYKILVASGFTCQFPFCTSLNMTRLDTLSLRRFWRTGVTQGMVLIKEAMLSGDMVLYKRNMHWKTHLGNPRIKMQPSMTFEDGFKCEVL